MQQFRCYGDDRNKGFCVHCGGPSETIDHVPSKVLLDEPYPENLMAAPACRKCNNGLSLDEEYLACLLECVIAGDIAPEKLHRAKIGRILRANSSLLTRRLPQESPQTRGNRRDRARKSPNRERLGLQYWWRMVDRRTGFSVSRFEPVKTPADCRGDRCMSRPLPQRSGNPLPGIRAGACPTFGAMPGGRRRRNQ